SVDAVLCRWGYMLMSDPAAALSETRRVLRPGGRVALAVWDRLERNPWAGVPSKALLEQGLEPARQEGAGPFALSDRERLGTLLEEAGFTEILVDAVAVEQRPESFEHFWEATLDLSRNFHDVVLSQDEVQIERIRAGLTQALEPFAAPDGALAIPGSSLVAV